MADFANFWPDNEAMWEIQADGGEDGEDDGQGENEPQFQAVDEENEDAWVEPLVGWPAANAPWPTPAWEHDPTPFDTAAAASVWDSPQISAIGIASSPYINDYLGLASSYPDSWTYMSIYEWEMRVQEPDWQPGTPTEQDDIVVGPATDTAAWTIPNPPITRLTAELLCYVFKHLSTDDNRAPTAGFYNKTGEGRRSLDDIVSTLHVCRWWYHTCMSLRTIWADLATAGKNQYILQLLLERAGSADLRIAYGGSVASEVIDSLLPRAAAVYATNCSPWKLYSPTFAGLALLRLEVLVLKPLEDDCPAVALPSHQGLPLNAPRLRLLHTSSPLAAVAPRMAELSLSYHTADQIRTILTPGTKLTRLEINRPRERLPFNWTLFLQEHDFSRLAWLKIRALDYQSARLDITAERLHMPSLSHLDVTGPVSIKAANVVFAKVFNVRPDEMIFMLEEMRTAVELHIRWLRPAAAQSLARYDERIVLNRLTQLSFAGDLSYATAVFLDGVRVPHLKDIRLFARMQPPGDNDVLRTVNQSLTAALQTNGEDEAALLASIRDAEEALNSASRGDVASAIYGMSIPSFADDGSDAEDAALTLQVLRNAAVVLLAALDDAERVPQVEHGGVVLAEVVRLALLAADLAPGCEELRVWAGYEERNVHFEAKLNNGSCLMRFSLVPDHNCGYNPNPTDSLTLRVARMLFGLETLRPRVLSFCGEQLVCPERVMGSSVFGTPDMVALRDALAMYESVEAIRVDYRGQARTEPRYLFMALGSSTTLPNLHTAIVMFQGLYTYVRSGADVFSGPREVSTSIWYSLVEMLRERAEGRNHIGTLILKGEFCLQNVHMEAVEAWVEVVDVTAIECQYGGPGGKDNCPACSSRQ